MKLCSILVLLLLLFINMNQWQWQCPIWVGATTPSFSILLYNSISSPVSSPSLSPISSPLLIGNQMGIDENQMEVHKRMAIALAVVCSTLATILLALLCLWIYRRNDGHKSRKRKTLSSDAEKGFGLAPIFSKFNSIWMVGKKGSVSMIDHKVFEKATGNFMETNILGEGGFGTVYKAQLDEKLIVAVKKLDCSSQDAETEFENEVNLLSKIRHPNIICQLGCSIDGDTKFIVYELMENGSLETQLHGPSHGSSLNWHMRMKIALDTARGLEYLHEHCHPAVIHRDLKTSNILLDANFNAKLSDFGLAINDGTQNKDDIKLSGTLGYLAPKYLLDGMIEFLDNDGEWIMNQRGSFHLSKRHGKLTDKSDVYAFGIVLLELILGRRPVEKLAPAQCRSIVTWAMPQLTDRSKLPNIVDPVIRYTMDLKHLYQVTAVAVLCVQPEPSYRPLITDVLHSLVPLVPVELGGTLRHIGHEGDTVSTNRH